MEKCTMTLQEAIEYQNTMVQLSARDPLAPWCGVFEASESLNDANRLVIRAMHTCYGSVYLGYINPVQDTNGVGLVEYTRQELYNSCCDFCVPTYDEELESEIQQWRRQMDMDCLERIHQRIDKLHGVLMIWS